MDWHYMPKNDAWKQAHLEMLVNLGIDLMLMCDHCQRRTEKTERKRLKAILAEYAEARPMTARMCAASCMNLSSGARGGQTWRSPAWHYDRMTPTAA
jgi:hypothetical protein